MWLKVFSWRMHKKSAKSPVPVFYFIQTNSRSSLWKSTITGSLQGCLKANEWAAAPHTPDLLEEKSVLGHWTATTREYLGRGTKSREILLQSPKHSQPGLGFHGKLHPCWLDKCLLSGREFYFKKSYSRSLCINLSFIWEYI